MNIWKKLVERWATLIGRLSGTEGLYLKVESSFPQGMTIPQNSKNQDTEVNLEDEVYLKFKKHIKLREGEVKDKKTGKHKVYKDSLGKPTVGWGHLVRPEDNLKVGGLITEKRVEGFFKVDSKEALDAAYGQAEELGHSNNVDFIVALASVNYQLGTGWVRKFKNTYAHIKNKKYNSAIRNLRRSLWFKQTPVRVNDFIDALAKL